MSDPYENNLDNYEDYSDQNPDDYVEQYDLDSQDEVASDLYNDFSKIRPEQSKIGFPDMWGRPPASDIKTAQTYQDIFGRDPYQAAKSLVEEDLAIYKTYYNLNKAEQTVKAEVLNNRVIGISQFFGAAVRANTSYNRQLGIYNRTVDQSRNIIPKTAFDTRRLGTRSPQGFKSRAIDVDYANWFEGNLNAPDVKGFKGTFYQFGESNVVSSIMSSDKPVDITTQTYSPVKAEESKDYFDQQRTAVRIAMESQVTKAVFDSSPQKNIHSASVLEGEFHPKVGYFYGKGGEVISAVFGTQNITTALGKNNTIEEVLFLSNRNNNIAAKAVLSEIKTVADILQESTTKTPENIRSYIDSRVQTVFDVWKPAQYVSVNRQVTEKAVDILGNIGDKQKAIVSIQFLEHLFTSKNSDSNKDFSDHRSKAIENLKNLIEADKVAIAMSDISFGKDQGLFSLIDKMRAKKDKSLSGVEREAYELFMLAERKNAFRSVNTQFMHSKSITVLDDNDQVVSYFVSSANWGEKSFSYNVETGLYLENQSDLFKNLGINQDHISKYAKGIWDNKSTGLYVEEKGVEIQVDKTASKLDQILQQAKDSGLNSPFRYSKRYINRDGKFEAVGLDIVLEDKMTFSVTIGESRTARYNRRTGKVDLKTTPIVYLNKGNRLITGAMWTNKSSSIINLNGRKVNPGQTIDIDAIDVLQGIMYTLHHSSKVEREQHILLQSLERLSNTSDQSLAKAVSRYFSSDADYIELSKRESDRQSFINEKVRFLRHIINTKDYTQVLEHNSLIREIIRANPAAEEYYNRDLRQSKSLMLATIIDIFAKPHELSYSYTQKLEDKASFGATDTNLNIMLPYRDRMATTVNLIAPIMSQVASEHSDLIYLNNLPVIRGVGATNRLESSNPFDMTGGLGKASGGTMTVKDLNIMNSMPGLMMISAAEYRQKLSKFITDKKHIELYTKLVFSEAASKLKDDETVDDEEVLLYFPYPKAEQISQRLKNLMSVRPFVGSSRAFADYVKSFGYTKFDRDKVVGSRLASAMPSVQYEIFKEAYKKNKELVTSKWLRSGYNHSIIKAAIDDEAWELTEKEMQRRALDLDDPMHGFVESPKLIFLGMGGSSRSDFSEVNMTAANRTGYVFTHRSQTAIDLDLLELSPVEFQSILQSKLKAGTMFVPLKTRIKQDNPLYDFIKDRFDEGKEVARTALAAENPNYTELDLLRRTQQEIKRLAKSGSAEYSFALSFDFIRNGVFDPYLKKGVFNPIYDTAGNFISIEKIGDIPEGSSAYYIDGLTRSQKAGTATRASGYFDVTNPSQGRRLPGAISVLSRDPQVSIVDRQPSMITLNLEYYTWQGFTTGMRTTTIKGPMYGKVESYFQGIKAMHDREHAEDFDSNKSYITQEDLFAISSPGQMKGFVFSTGYALLKEGWESPFYKVASDKDNNKIVEALSLLMLANKESDSEGAKSIKTLLSEFYETNKITNRTQFKALLDNAEPGNKLSFTDKNNLSKQSNSIALYEGLIGLIDSDYISLGEEQGLVKTLADALKSEDKKRALNERAAKLFSTFFSDSEYSVGQDKYSVGKNRGRVFNEQKGRSAAVLTFYMKAAESLLADIDQTRFTEKSISEIGYVSRDQAKDIIRTSLGEAINSYKSLPIALPIWNKHGQLMELEKLYNTSNNLYTDLITFSKRTDLHNDIADILNNLLNKTPGTISSYDAYLTRTRDREMYRAYGRSMGIELPSFTELSNAKDEKLKSLLEQLELGLHQMYTVGQAIRFMPIYVDPKANKNAPPVGMQNKTDLEGHYAQRLTELQLKMYTKSAQDYRAVDSVASVVLRLAGIVEADYGILNQTTLNSRYRLYDTHILSLGKWTNKSLKEAKRVAWKDESDKRTKLFDKEIEKAKAQSKDNSVPTEVREQLHKQYIKSLRGDRKHIERAAQEEAARTHALRFSLDFARAYSNISAKVPVNLLSGRTNINGRTVTVKGEYQSPPAYNALMSFINMVMGKPGSKDSYEKHLGYMTHVTAIARKASSDYSGEDELTQRRNAMLADYMEFVGSEAKSLGKQARDLVMTMLEPLDSLARTLSGDNFKGKLRYNSLNNSVDYEVIEQNPIHPFIIGPRIVKTHTFDAESKADLDALAADPNYIHSLSLERRRGLYQELLVKRFAKASGSKALIESILHDTSVIASDEVRKIISFVYEDAPDVERTLMESIIGKKIDDVIRANLLVDPGKEYVQGRQVLRDYAKSIVRSNEFVYSNPDVAAALGKPIGEGVLSESDVKNVYRFYKKESILTDTQKKLLQSYEQVYTAHKLMSAVSYTQSISIPYLKLIAEDNFDGTRKAVLLPNEEVKAEKGILLGLDIMERVSLVFPQYSSAALEAQQSFAEVLSLASQQGLLEKITNALEKGEEIKLTNAEVMLYRELLASARQSRETSAAIAENEKITRNAMGEQLPMKGASYIAVSSFLVASNEVAFGKERMGNILKLQEGGFSKLVKGYTEIITRGKSSDDAVKITLEALNQFAGFFKEGHTDVTNLNDFKDYLRDNIFTDGNTPEALIKAKEDKKKKEGPLSKSIEETLDKGIEEALRKDIYKDLKKNKVNKKNLEAAIRRFILGDKESLQDDEVEKQLYLSHFLKGRQGAPSATGYDFATGAQGIYLEEIYSRGELNLSQSLVDVDNGSTAMVLSAMGNEFTQLGDYDGDSFQAAINRLAEATAEVKKAQELYTAALQGESSVPASNAVKYPNEDSYIKANIASTSSDYVEASRILAEKTQALTDLQREAKNSAKENIRKYAQSFLGLSNDLFQSENEDRVDRLGVLSDEEIAPLVKQYRDTISGWYDNQKAVKGHLSKFLAEEVQDLSLVTGDIFLKDGKTRDTLQDDKKAIYDEIITIIDQHKAINEGNTVDKATIIERKQDLLQTAAIVSQMDMSLESVSGITKKMLGSQLSQTNFAQVQAIVGATGTGLLGKTYNTIIPLLSISAGNSAMIHTLENNRDMIAESLESAIKVMRKGTLSQSEGDFLQNLQTGYLSDVAKGNYQYNSEAMLAKAQQKSNAMFGLLMNVQQFLRDAALKPKESKKKGGDDSSKSILDLASEFEIQGIKDLDYLEGHRGLADLLNNARSAQDKSLVMEEFITKKAGFSLETLFKTDPSQSSDVSKLKAFSALQLMNEYLSGTYNADEMFEKSSFRGFLQTIREDNIRDNAEKGTPLKSSIQIVEEVLKESITNFRTQFIYDSVLEGENRTVQLRQSTEKLAEAFDLDFNNGADNTEKSVIADRVEKYRQYLTKTMSAGSGTLTKDQQESIINKDVEAYEAEQLSQKEILRQALSSTDNPDTKVQNVWKAIIQKNIQKQTDLVFSSEEGNSIISQVREFNKYMQGIREGTLPGTYDANTAELALSSIGAALGRAKLTSLTTAQVGNYLLQLANNAGDGNNLQAMTSLMSGMGLSTQNFDFIKQAAESVVEKRVLEAETQAALNSESLTEEKKAEIREKTRIELDQASAKLMMQSFISDGEQTSVAQKLTEAHTVTAKLVEMEKSAETAKAASQVFGETNPLIASYAQELEDQLKTYKSTSPDQQYKQAMTSPAEFDPLGDQLNAAMRTRYFEEMSKLRSEYVQESVKQSKRSHKVSGLVSLLAVPTLFSVIQGDITFNDRVADMFNNIGQAALSTVSYKDSTLFKTLYSDPELTNDRTKAEKAAERANTTMQYARIAESIRRHQSLTEGLVKGIAFEAIYSSASIAASEISSKVFGKNLAANIAAEVGGGLLGIMLANSITERSVPGSFGGYDYAYDITMRMIKRVKDNILAAGSALTSQLISGNDVSEDLQAYTSNSNESLNQVASTADISLNGELNNMPLAVSLAYRDGSGMGEQLVADVYVQGDLEYGDVLISLEGYEGDEFNG